MSTYSEIKKYGLTNNMLVHPIYDKIIPLENTNKYFFGTPSTPVSTCNQLLIMKKIVIEYKKTLYIILSKLKDYIECLGDLSNYDTNYIMINYNNFIKKELTGFQNEINKFNQNFINYLSKTKPLFYKTIICIMGEEYFNGKMIGYEKVTNICSIMYDMIPIYYGDINMDSKLYVNYMNYNESTFEKLYNDIKMELLMKDVNEFVKYNLTKLLGNDSFAELLVYSNNIKDDHCIDIMLIAGMIIFKNDKMMNKYIDHFKKLYEENTIWKDIDDTTYLNFEGLNKFFLNLETSYLETFEMKEHVNNLYYKITDELISSYKTLYNYLKK